MKQNGKIKKRDLIKKILVDGDLITIEKLLETTGCTEEDVKKWKAGRKIICVDIYGRELFAAYCIDRDSGVPINGISDLISKLPFQKNKSGGCSMVFKRKCAAGWSEAKVFD